MAAPSRLDSVVSLAKRRGFVFPSGEIYGGTRSAWDYGPLGVELKENIKRQWWRAMVTSRDDIVGLDSSVILPRQVWVASGHVGVFTDPLTECLSCHKRFREDQLLEEFTISRLRKAPSIALSGGERRRCEIARALAGKPSFILLDEPFAGIDPIAVGDIQALVRQLTDRGIGVLITDHNVRETLGLVDRAYIIHSGRVLTEGSPAEIIANPDVRRVYLGEDFRL